MSFPRYEHYKDSGVEWLGEVPAHWDVAPLKQVISKIESGTSVNAIDTPASGDELGVLKTSCVYRGEFDPSENKAIVAEEYDRAACPVTAGTLIVSRMNTPDLVGAAGVVNKTEENLFLPDRLWQVHFRGANPSFVHFWCNTNSYRAQVEMACAGASSSMQNLAQDQFRSFVLPKPTLVEQDQIAAFLTRETAKLDALITEQRTLIDLLKEKRQAVISHAVTKGLDPDVAMKDSGVEWLGEVPAHWEIVRLKRAVVLQRGHDLPSEERQEGEIPIVSSGGITGWHHQAQAKGPGIVTGRYGTIGQFTFVEDDYWPLNTTLYSVDLFDNVPRFIWYMLQNISVLFLMNSGKSAVPGVDRNDLHPVPVVVPPVIEQNGIVDFLAIEIARLDALTAEAETTIALLQERRSALISAAVTGKIDVRQAA